MANRLGGVWHGDVPRGSGRLAVFLERLRAFAGLGGTVERDRETLARALQRSPETIRRWEHELEAQGLAVIEQHRLNVPRRLHLLAPAETAVPQLSAVPVPQPRPVRGSGVIGTRVCARPRSDSEPPSRFASTVAHRAHLVPAPAEPALGPSSPPGSAPSLVSQFLCLRGRLPRALNLAPNTWPRALEYLDRIAAATGYAHALRYMARLISHNAQRFAGERLGRVSFGALKAYASRLAGAVSQTVLDSLHEIEQRVFHVRPALAAFVSGTAPVRSRAAARRLFDLTPDLFPAEEGGTR